MTEPDAPLRVLLVEDSAEDAELVLRTLGAGGLGVEPRLVAGEAEYRARLADFAPELILADWRMPGFSGAAAVAIAQAWNPTVPCILVSGTLGEEIVVEALRTGATDYVLKQRLEGLVPAIRRALAEAEERRARLHLEAELASTRASMETSLDAMLDPFLICASVRDEAGAVTGFRAIFANRAAQLYMGRMPDLLTGLSTDHGHPLLGGRPFFDAFLQVTQTGNAWVADGLEFTFPGPKGSRREGIINIQSAKSGDGFFATWQDVTERRLADQERAVFEARLRQAEKMESVGLLAGGVAHDFNNLLSVILGNARWALAESDPASASHVALKEIEEAAERSASLTRQLMAFARQQTIAPRVVDVNNTVSHTLEMLRRLVPEGTDLIWTPSEGVGNIQIDPTQFDQILINLVVNARDSIEGTGRIWIETCDTVLDERYCSEHPGAQPGAYVVISVTDDGCGMDADTISHVFEPFFTTKGVGQGTGLGLATVYGIVKQDNGFIVADSEVGVGTTMRVYLPITVEPAEAPAKQRPSSSEGGRETVLLVEDEPALLRLSAAMLQRLGYHVIPAASPAEAIRIAQTTGGVIDLLFTDVIMPGMDGRHLAQTLQSTMPSLRCLFTSGYPAEAIGDHGVLDPGINFLHKPFSQEGLASAVRTALEGAPSAAVEDGFDRSGRPT